MRVVNPSPLDELSFDSSSAASKKLKVPGRVLSYLSAACGVFLIALVAWFTFFLAGATIDSGTFFTGPVGAVFGAFLAVGIVLSLCSSGFALGVRLRATKGSAERARAWLVWVAANAFFVVGVVCASVIVSAKLA
jgi:hypothetical protein